jgi:acyl-coenzyme A synthetase/AMP-(fatty) acid ligase/pimeloyl-ACP methyl ester carboxylesterase
VTTGVLPTSGLAELDPSFSHRASVPGTGVDAGSAREWHYLDTAAALAELGREPDGTILAVHGNPTWSYLWRSVLSRSVGIARAGGPAWRVVAVDQLEMGWSERTGAARTLEQRVADLGCFTDALALRGPVVTLGHDWGGVISLGWATEHPELLAGVMLLNTAVHQPAGVAIPAPLRLARARGMIEVGSVGTTAFLDTTLSLASPALERAVRDAYRSPYATAERRRGIGSFVADIPVGPGHPSFDRLERLGADVATLRVPALMLWGPRDPIFSDRYLDDLVERVPHADVHRFEGAGHLVIEDAPVAESLFTWLGDNHDALIASDTGESTTDAATASPVTRTAPAPDADAPPFSPLWDRLVSRRDDGSAAIVEPLPHESGAVRRVSWKQLDDRVSRLAAGLHDIGVRRGDRVSLLVTPGATLTAVVYACLRIGAIVVVADAGLGVKGLGRAIRGAWPDVVIGEVPGLAAARALGWPGRRISAARLPRASAAALGVELSLADLVARGGSGTLPEEPRAEDPAAILYTSGSTGPAKGVVYSHGQLSALRDTLQSTFALTPNSGLVTGFAPFALLGPALGALSSTPVMDVSSPRTLTARAVATAVREAHGDIVFLSPAAILNVVATAGELSTDDRAALDEVRTVLSTGAPVSERMLTSLVEVMPNATAHAVYGMTECLLVSDITLDELRSIGASAPDDGVCVGRPIDGVQVRISALDEDGASTGEPALTPGVLGEVVISAPHLKTHYDRLWLTDRESLRDTPADGRWHRTGDVGHLDSAGRLWIEGRLPHVVVTQDGPLAPVGVEQAIETVRAVRRAAVVGVGPHRLRQLVAVVETEPRGRGARLASEELVHAVRASTEHPIVAVLVVEQLPTDIRHNSKIDRSRLSGWAEQILAGNRPTAP